MKKILVILTIMFVIGVLASIFIPSNVYAGNVFYVGDGIPEAASTLKDPHFHSGEWTTCMNQLSLDCDSEAPDV